jgi:nucleoside-diphosphate-sugar epimerase
MISILGCGWYGFALGQAMVKNGTPVKGSTTSADGHDRLNAAGIKPYTVKATANGVDADAGFFDCEVLVISIPPKLRSGETDYAEKIEQIAQTVAAHQIKKVIYISSTGVYPECNCTVDEQTQPPADTESGRLLADAENRLMGRTDFKTAIIRFGGLVGPGRHPGRFFGGKSNIPNGQAPVNLIHLQDCIGVTLSILSKDAFGYIFNTVAPHHPQKQDFYTKAAEDMGLPLPHFLNELGTWKIVNSLNIPSLLQYDFKVANWDDCFGEKSICLMYYL